jgi:hypothetical protein
MKRRIYLMAAITVLTGIVGIGLTPARAIMPDINLQARANSSVAYVHCRRTYHCYWTIKGDTKVRRCHVCG